MKKGYLIIGFVILILIVASIFIFFYFDNKTDNKIKCEFMNADGCDKSCKTDSDCKFSIGYCVNTNENVFLSEFEIPAYEEQTCKCESNKCVGEPTGRVAR